MIFVIAAVNFVVVAVLHMGFVSLTADSNLTNVQFTLVRVIVTTAPMVLAAGVAGRVCPDLSPFAGGSVIFLSGALYTLLLAGETVFPNEKTRSILAIVHIAMWLPFCIHAFQFGVQTVEEDRGVPVELSEMALERESSERVAVLNNRREDSYGATLIRGNFAASPALVVGALEIEMAEGAEVQEFNNPVEAKFATAQATGRSHTRNFLFYEIGDWTVFAASSLDFADLGRIVRASATLATEVVTLGGMDGQGFKFAVAREGVSMRQISALESECKLEGEPIDGEPEGPPQEWGYRTAADLAQSIGAPDLPETIPTPCYVLELEVSSAV